MRLTNYLETFATLLIAVCVTFFFAVCTQNALTSKLEHAFVNHSENLVVLKNQALQLPFKDATYGRILGSRVDIALSQLEELNRAANAIESTFPSTFWLGESNQNEVAVYYTTVGAYLNNLSKITESSLSSDESISAIDEETLSAIISEEVHFAGVDIHEHLMGALFTTNDGVVLSLASIFAAFVLIIILHLYRNIEALKESQDELKKSLVRAEQASHAKTLFLSSMTHEFRTPMNGVLGIAELLKADERLQHDHQENIEILINSGTQLLTLLEDVLAYSKIEQGRIKLVEHQFSLSTLVFPLESLFKEESRNKGLLFNVSSNIPSEAMFVGDQSKIRKIIFHLLSNAIKFTHHGSVDLNLEYDKSLNMLIIRVNDTGVGIEASAQDAIFDAFEQVESSFTREFDGAGLGLAIVNHLTSLMDGDIKVESQIGQGSSFTVRLRVREYLTEVAMEAQSVHP